MRILRIFPLNDSLHLMLLLEIWAYELIGLLIQIRVLPKYWMVVCDRLLFLALLYDKDLLRALTRVGDISLMVLWSPHVHCLIHQIVLQALIPLLLLSKLLLLLLQLELPLPL